MKKLLAALIVNGLIVGSGLLGDPLADFVVMLVRAVIHALEQSAGEANQQVMVFLAVLRHADPARQRNGGVGEGHVVGQLGGVRQLLKNLQAVRTPGCAGVHAAGEHRGHDGGSVHVHRLDVVHGHAGLVEGVLEDVLGGRAGGVGHNLALQVFHRGNALAADERVAIARAYAANPEVLLMDEPFGALDAQTRTQLQTELLETWEREKKTCFFITHDVEEAIILAQRVIIMSARPGRIKDIVDVNIPYPRTQETKLTPEFNELKNHIWSQVYQEYLAVRK